jgi:hypothetical protein
VGKSQLDAFTEVGLWGPAEHGHDTAGVAIVTTDVEEAVLRREGFEADIDPAGFLAQDGGNLAERKDFRAGDVEKALWRVDASSSEQEGIDRVVDIDGVAELLSIAEDFEGLTIESAAEEDREESLTRDVEGEAGAVGVGQAQDDRVEHAKAVVKQVILFGGALVNPIEITGVHWVIFMYRELEGATANLARGGVDDTDARP